METTNSSILGLRKEGIKVTSVFFNMVVIGIGFMQFGKLAFPLAMWKQRIFKAVSWCLYDSKLASFIQELASHRGALFRARLPVLTAGATTKRQSTTLS